MLHELFFFEKREIPGHFHLACMLSVDFIPVTGIKTINIVVN